MESLRLLLRSDGRREREADLQGAEARREAPDRAAARRTMADLGLRFDLTVPLARYYAHNRVAPAPAAQGHPDRAGVAGGAPAAGPLPPVHPVRHRRAGRGLGGRRDRADPRHHRGARRARPQGPHGPAQRPPGARRDGGALRLRPRRGPARSSSRSTSSTRSGRTRSPPSCARRDIPADAADAAARPAGPADHPRRPPGAARRGRGGGRVDRAPAHPGHRHRTGRGPVPARRSTPPWCAAWATTPAPSSRCGTATPLRSLAGGGRYDRMVGRFIGRDVPATGFSIGFERVIGLLLERGSSTEGDGDRIALVFDETMDLAPVLALARDLREQGHPVLLETRAKRMGKQLQDLETRGFRRIGVDGRGRHRGVARDSDRHGGGGRSVTESLGGWRRTHSCGALRSEHVGQTVTLMGWAYRRRDHGGLVFIDLRDREGLTQCVFNPGGGRRGARQGGVGARRVRAGGAGTVGARPAGTENPKLATGAVEVQVSRDPRPQRVAAAAVPARRRGDIDETLRLKYRYLDMRRPRVLQRVPGARSGVPRRRATTCTRDGFLEVETPFLTRSTPGGRARLPGAEPAAARQLLRAAPVAAALQAAPDGGRLRALLPDRALLPRRGPARGPPAGVHPDRHRDLVPRPRRLPAHRSKGWWPRSGRR